MLHSRSYLGWFQWLTLVMCSTQGLPSGGIAMQPRGSSKDSDRWEWYHVPSCMAHAYPLASLKKVIHSGLASPWPYWGVCKSMQKLHYRYSRGRPYTDTPVLHELPQSLRTQKSSLQGHVRWHRIILTRWNWQSIWCSPCLLVISAYIYNII